MKKATNGERCRKAEWSAEHHRQCQTMSTLVGGEWNFAAFEEWVGGCEDKAFRLAMHFLRDERAAQDILQETFLAAWENIQAFANRNRFNAWVYRMTVKAALERLNSSRSRGQIRLAERERWPRNTGWLNGLASNGEKAERGRLKRELRTW